MEGNGVNLQNKAAYGESMEMQFSSAHLGKTAL